ncbi:unnamed protein product [Acanthoscelides obtectus]|uniref:Uncharacterized protein n=1 Tax=Acanthoscelides obtectus TaxID=200917 RepID=A0A9P0LDC2_ACAOB|nr:unnamed protein product [Acanthoscelides obtectus]CAK1662405.1 hypothetical protein AOBTE_LOCUS23130 [Acanthoscelides obtectus]
MKKQLLIKENKKKLEIMQLEYEERKKREDEETKRVLIQLPEKLEISDFSINSAIKYHFNKPSGNN